MNSNHKALTGAILESNETSNIISRFGGLLACSCSSASFRAFTENALTCEACGRSLESIGPIFVDSQLSDTENFLEKIDYDLLHGVSIAGSKHYGIRWLDHVRRKIPSQNELDILEIGAGTGLLTAGIVMAGDFRRLIVTDLSSKFLSANCALINSLPDANLEKILYVQCSVDDLPIKAESINVVLANSVLHHIYDYELALRKLFRILRPGGIAFFSEPIIEGKAFVGFLAATIRSIDAGLATPFFTTGEHTLLSDLSILCTKKFWKDVAVQKKDTADDKHLFGLPELRRVAKDMGWSDIEVVSYDPINDGLFGALEDSFRIMQIRTEPLEHYRYLFKAFQDQVVDEIPHHVFTPHAFLIFRK